MTEKYTRYAIIVAFLVCVCGAYVFVSAQTTDGISGNFVSGCDTDSAIQIALAFTGFDKTDGYLPENIVAPRRVQIQQDTTVAILHQLLHGREAWSITFRDVYYREEHRAGIEPRVVGPRDFDVFIDVESGNLLKIISVRQDTVALARERCWKEIVVLPPRTPGKRIAFTHQPSQYSLVDVLEYGMNIWVPDPVEFEAYYLDFVSTEGTPPDQSESDETSGMWFTLSKKVTVDPFRPSDGTECIVAPRCFDITRGRLGGCGGYTARSVESFHK